MHKINTQSKSCSCGCLLATLVHHFTESHQDCHRIVTGMSRTVSPYEDCKTSLLLIFILS